jgi:hypothetical protein
MNTATLAAFALVANGTPSENSVFEGSERMTTLLRKAQKNAEEAAEAAILVELQDIVEAVQARLDEAAGDIRSLQSTIKAVEGERDAILAAQAHGVATANYLPLLSAIGVVGPADAGRAGFTGEEWLSLTTVPVATTEG